MKMQAVIRLRMICPLMEALNHSASLPPRNETPPKTTSVASWKRRPKGDDLKRDIPEFRLGKLWEEGEKEKRDLGIGNVHDHTPPVQGPVSGKGTLLQPCPGGTATERKPCQIQQIGRPCTFQDCKGRLGCLKQCRNAEGNGCRMPEEPRSSALTWSRYRPESHTGRTGLKQKCYRVRGPAPSLWR